MFKTLVSLLPSKKSRDVATTAAGMAALLTGQKVAALGAFAKGVAGLEEAWREANPDFEGTFSDRWERAITFYEDTHAHPVNRKLHVVGIPMILGGAAGLLLFRPFRPLWMASATSFTVGWGLNIVGHVVYEKNAPAFADDPLAFVAGPIWDFKQGGKARAERATEARRSDGVAEPDEVMDPDGINVGGEPAVA